MRALKIYSRYDCPKVKGLVNTGECVTQQHFKKECDVNVIVDSFVRTGMLKDDGKKYVFGDVYNEFDYRQGLDMVIQADEMFRELPAKVRERFKNDPGELLMFISDDENREEAIKLGLIDKPAQLPLDVTVLSDTDKEVKA